MGKLQSALLILLLVACGSKKEAEPDKCDQSLTSDQIDIDRNYKWAKQTDIFLPKGASLELKDSTNKAARIWNEAIGFSLINIKDSRVDNEQSEATHSENNRLYLADNYNSIFPDKSTEKIATTSFNTQAQEIVSGSIYLNTANYAFRDLAISGKIESENGKPVYDLPSIIVHEMGHFIGANHSDDISAIMYPYLEKNTIKLELCPNEVLTAKKLYSSPN